MKSGSKSIHSCHTLLVGYQTHKIALKAIAGNDTSLVDAGVEYIAEVFDKNKPRDSLEEMLLMQVLWTQIRLARLTMLANRQTGLDQLKVINEACDRASNALGRLMLTLAEYRRPPRHDTFAPDQTSKPCPSVGHSKH